MYFFLFSSRSLLNFEILLIYIVNDVYKGIRCIANFISCPFICQNIRSNVLKL